MKAFHGLGVSNVVIFLAMVVSCITAIPTGDSVPTTLHGTLEARAGPTAVDIRNIASTTFGMFFSTSLMLHMNSIDS